MTVIGEAIQKGVHDREARHPSGRKLAITVEPLHELRPAQLRQLGEEADLVGTVMEATATLTVGPVTVGPHA